LDTETCGYFSCDFDLRALLLSRVWAHGCIDDCIFGEGLPEVLVLTNPYLVECSIKWLFMAKRANRGCGRKKNLKLLAREASIVLEDALLSLDCGAKLSEANENCESLDCEDAILELEAQRFAGSVSTVKLSANGVDVNSVRPEMEILENFGVHEDKKEPTVVVPDEKNNIA
jgi:hypothetical protein